MRSTTKLVRNVAVGDTVALLRGEHRGVALIIDAVTDHGIGNRTFDARRAPSLRITLNEDESVRMVDETELP